MKHPSKKIHRFRVDTLPDADTDTITDQRIVHQVVRVLALQEGEEIILFADRSDDMVARIERIERSAIAVRMVRMVPQLPAPRMELIAAISIPKRDTFELIVQKLTELGVSQIIPIRSERTIKQSVRIDRLQTISDEAVEQCGGNRIVTIDEPVSLTECLSRHPLPTIIFDANGSPLPDKRESPGSCIMYIGPEGGWSDGDRAQFDATRTSSAVPIAFITLSPRTLRTDTAAIVGAHTLLWH